MSDYQEVRQSSCELFILGAERSSDEPEWIARAKIIPQSLDTYYDLAVIRLTDKYSQIPITLSGRTPIQIKNVTLGFGEKLKTLGYPGSGGTRITISSGEQSGWYDDADSDGEFYKTSAKGGPGESGGAAFNDETGDFIGVPTAGTMSDVADVFGLIRPNSYVIPLLDKATRYG